MAISIKAARKNLSDMAAGKRQLQGKSIPVDVIETILSRLPVKSLIKFQLLSKSWKATIFDPCFAKINYNHLPKPHNLFISEDPKRNKFSLERLEGASNLQTEAEFSAPPFGPFGAVPLCSCNGIVLLAFWEDNPCGGRFLLWNPSIRRYTTVSVPDKLNIPWFYAGLYHDSSTDDYKIAVIWEKRSMVYSCKARTWAEEEAIPCSESPGMGVLVDGCFYWLKDGDVSCEKILRYDFRERKTEQLKLPEKVFGELRLTSLLGRPCLRRKERVGQVWMRENHGWRELDYTGDYIYWQMGYDLRFGIRSDCEEGMEYFTIFDCSRLVPYSESLFFPFETERIQRY